MTPLQCQRMLATNTNYFRVSRLQLPRSPFIARGAKAGWRESVDMARIQGERTRSYRGNDRVSSGTFILLRWKWLIGEISSFFYSEQLARRLQEEEQKQVAQAQAEGARAGSCSSAAANRQQQSNEDLPRQQPPTKKKSDVSFHTFSHRIEKR